MALRLRRICSTDEFFNTRSDALTTYLIKRGYPHRFIKEEIEKVRHIPRSKALETSMKNQSNRILFVVTFNPDLPNIRRIIFNNLNILRSSQRSKAKLHDFFRRAIVLFEGLILKREMTDSLRFKYILCHQV